MSVREYGRARRARAVRRLDEHGHREAREPGICVRDRPPAADGSSPASRERVAPHGLTTLQFTTLSVLSRHGAPLSTSQLARRAFMTPQSMSEVIHALEGKGLIERNPAPESPPDAPATLTPQGRRVLAACEEAVADFEELDAPGLHRARSARPSCEMIKAAVRNLGRRLSA